MHQIDVELIIRQSPHLFISLHVVKVQHVKVVELLVHHLSHFEFDVELCVEDLQLAYL